MTGPDDIAAALREALRIHDREVRVLSVALYVAVTAPEILARGPGSDQTWKEWETFETDLREALRLAGLYATTRCTDAERISVDDATKILFDALGEAAPVPTGLP